MYGKRPSVSECIWGGTPGNERPDNRRPGSGRRTDCSVMSVGLRGSEEALDAAGAKSGLS